MKPVITVVVMLSFFFVGSVKAQSDTTVLFLDSNYKVIQRGLAVYGEAITRRDRLYFVTLTDMKKMTTLYTGSYRDKALSIKEGIFTYFTRNVETMRGLYHNDKQVGTWKQWNTEHLLVDSVILDDDGDLLSEYKYSYHVNKTPWRYVFANNADQKISMEFDTAGHVVSEGKFNGSSGETFMYYPGGKVKMHSVFKEEKRILFEFFDEEGKKYNEEGYAQYITTHQK